MRIERWLLYLQQFDYQLKSCPGKQNAADNLSRHMLPLTESDVQTSEARKQVVHSIITDKAPHAISLADIQAATKKDSGSQEAHPTYLGWQSSCLQIRSRPGKVRTGVP